MSVDQSGQATLLSFDWLNRSRGWNYLDVTSKWGKELSFFLSNWYSTLLNWYHAKGSDWKWPRKFPLKPLTNDTVHPDQFPTVTSDAIARRIYDSKLFKMRALIYWGHPHFFSQIRDDHDQNQSFEFVSDEFNWKTLGNSKKVGRLKNSNVHFRFNETVLEHLSGRKTVEFRFVDHVCLIWCLNANKSPIFLYYRIQPLYSL